MILKIMMTINHGKLRCPPPAHLAPANTAITLPLMVNMDQHHQHYHQHHHHQQQHQHHEHHQNIETQTWVGRWTHRLNSGLPRLGGVMYLATIRGGGEAKNCPEWSLNLREGRVQGRKKWDSGLRSVFFALSHTQVMCSFWDWLVWWDWWF